MKNCSTPEIPGRLIDPRRLIPIVLLLFFILGASPASHSGLVIKELPSPAARGGVTPYLHSSADRALMSWQQEANGRVELRFAAWQNDKWTPSRAIVSDAPLFRNWADFPSILSLDGETIAAHWLQKSGAGSYAYDTMITFSNDGGSTWKPAVKPHHDSTAGEHGFVSLVPMDHAGLMAVWLDSRNFKNEHDEDDPLNEMQLMAGIYQSGNFGKETVLDPRTCDCCQTSAVKTKNGIFVAYRDRSEKEIRDISFVRYVNNQWTAPKTLHPDGWQISGCPVNGPAAAAWNGQVIVSWFTAAGNEPHVNAALSFDDGRTFGKVLRLDEGNPSGRVDTEFLPDGSALVSWIENSKTQGPHIMVRRIFKDGTLDTPIVVAASTTDRAGGFPRMASWQKGVLLAYTEIGNDDSRIRVVSIQPK